MEIQYLYARVLRSSKAYIETRIEPSKRSHGHVNIYLRVNLNHIF
jgi:hypothetical protein